MDTTRMSIDVPANLHKMIKVSAMMHDQTIRDFVVDAIERRLAAERKRRPNALTRRTLEKSARGKDLHAYASYEDFLKEMGFE